MEIYSAPKLNSFVPVKPISYTELTLMDGCLLRGLINTRGIIDNQIKVSSVSKDLICGYIFHHLLYEAEKYNESEINFRRSAIRKDIDLLIENYAKRYPGFSFRDYQYWPKLEKIISSVLKKANKNLLNVIDREKRIETKDATAVGIIDVIERSSDGLVIIDYKSRSFVEGSEMSKVYFEQLHFYALLVQEEYGDYPNKGYIEYFDNERSLVELDSDFSDELHKKAKSIYFKLKNVTAGDLSTKSIANLHVNECNNCSVSYLCPELNKTILNEDSGLSRFLEAEVKVVGSSNIQVIVKSGIVCGSYNHNIIIKTPVEYSGHFIMDHSYIFTDLICVDLNIYDLSSNSKVYSK